MTGMIESKVRDGTFRVGGDSERWYHTPKQFLLVIQHKSAQIWWSNVAIEARTQPEEKTPINPIPQAQQQVGEKVSIRNVAGETHKPPEKNCFC